MRESERRRNKKYQKNKCRTYSLKFSINKNQSIIAHLDSKDNVQGYIKGLILADIEKGEENGEKM
jgi:hypothetical protein